MGANINLATISLAIPRPLLEDLDKYMKERRYINRSDFIRQAIKEKLEIETSEKKKV